MKTQKFQKRFYRDWVRMHDLRLTHIMAKETDLLILTNRKLDKDFVEERIRSYRWDIEHYITKDNRFLTALKPLAVELTAPPIVKAMSQASRLADVGPMATVAGAIADFLGSDLLRQGYKEVIIENGGDVFIKSHKARFVGIYAGKSKVWNNLRIKIKASRAGLGICTSSATVGHSLSFGSADSVVIIAKNATLADAVATATCNRVNTKYDLRIALEFARSIKGVLGAAIILKDNLVSWGKIEFAKNAKD